MKRKILTFALCVGLCSMIVSVASSQPNKVAIKENNEETKMEVTPIVEHVQDEVIEEIIDNEQEEKINNVEAVENVSENIEEESSIFTPDSQSMANVNINEANLELVENGDGTYTLKGCNDNSTNINISQSSYTITAIADDAFKDNKNLKSITISNVGLTTIGNRAFYGCTNLETITLPNTVNNVGGFAFYKTKWLNLQKAEYGDKLVYVNDVLVDGSGASGNVVVKDTCQSISPYAFIYNYNIKTVKLNNLISRLPYGAFFGCENLESIDLNNISTIANNAFYSCKSLTTLSNINSKLQTIGDYAFENCTSLKTLDMSASGVTRVSFGRGSFRNSGLETIKFNLYVESIGICAFQNCTNLKEITFDASTSSLNFVGTGAFMNCKQLKTIVNSDKIPASVNKLAVFVGTQIL